jgi:hypothetical protein
VLESEDMLESTFSQLSSASNSSSTIEAFVNSLTIAQQYLHSTERFCLTQFTSFCFIANSSIPEQRVVCVPYPIIAARVKHSYWSLFQLVSVSGVPSAIIIDGNVQYYSSASLNMWFEVLYGGSIIDGIPELLINSINNQKLLY